MCYRTDELHYSFGVTQVPNIPFRNGGPSARIALIPGDGIGKEVTPVAVKCIQAAAVKRSRPLEFVHFDWGADKFLRENITLPPGAVEMLRDEFDAILFGALGDPRVPSNQHAAVILLGLPFTLDPFATPRPPALHPPLYTPRRDITCHAIRLMVFPENTEGLYVGVGGFYKKAPPHQIALEEDVTSRKAPHPNIRLAFEYCRSRKLKRP